MGKLLKPEDITADASSSSFMNFDVGENRFRIVDVGQYYKGGATESDGWRYIKGEIWTADDTQEGRDFVEEKLKSAQFKKVSPFLACVVIDRSAPGNPIKVLEINQKTIIRSIKTLWAQVEWGHPSAYDLTVIKSAEKNPTTFDVNPLPKTELTDDEKSRVKDFDFDLDKFYVTQHGRASNDEYEGVPIEARTEDSAPKPKPQDPF